MEKHIFDFLKVPIKLSFFLVTLLFLLIILGNTAGYFYLNKLHQQNNEIKVVFDLLQKRKTSLIAFNSAASNSIIGLASKNWNLLIEERKLSMQNIAHFEQTEKQFDFLLKKFGIELNLENLNQEIQIYWQDLKRWNIAVLRVKSSELTNSSDLLNMIEASKRMLDIYKKYETQLGDIIAEKERRTQRVIWSIAALNFGFQIFSIPLLIFVIFRPSLRRAVELEQAQAQNVSLSKLSALGEMAAGVAHEINTPLGAMMLGAELISAENAEQKEPNPSIENRAQTILDVGNRIAKIITAMKSYSRDSALDEKKTFTLSELLENTTILCEKGFQNHGVNLSIEGPLDFQMEGNINQLSQVLLNLLNNSFDAIQGLQEKWIHIMITYKNEIVEIRVVDSGPGLPVNVSEKIFQPFFTTKEIGKGTGLGLSIARNIIKNHEGDIFYQETHGHTGFVIQLPVKQRSRK